MFVAVLPFAKGKDIELILLPKGQILRFAVFDVGYYFSIYLSQILVCVAVYTSIRLYGFPGLKRQNVPTLLFYGLFIIIALVPVIYNRFPLVIMLSTVELLLLFLVFELPYLLHISTKVLQYVSHTLSAFVLFQTTWVVLQVFNHSPLGRDMESRRVSVFAAEDRSFMRYNGTFFESSILGTFMFMHLVYFSILLMQNEYKTMLEKRIYIATVIGSLISIIFTGSRGIYFLTAIFGLVFCWYYRQKIKPLVLRIKIRTISIFLVCFGLIFMPYIYTRLQSISSLFTYYGSGTYRIQIAQYAIRLAEKNIFGVGLNVSPYYFATAFSSEPFIFDPSHPHNIFFQILAEMGPVGLCIFVIFLWALYRPLLRRKVSWRVVPHAAASLAFLCAAQFYPIFISQPEIISFFFLYAGLMSWSLKKKKYE